MKYIGETEFYEIVRDISKTHSEIANTAERLFWRTIDRLGKIETKELARGEWINPEDIVCYQCSACGEYSNRELPDKPYNYCPWCGADMRGEKDG